MSGDALKMTLEQRMEKLEKAFGAQDSLVRELRDAVIVTAQLEARQSVLLREHSEWLAEHEASVARHNAWLVQHDPAMADLGRRIADLVGGFGEFLRRQDPQSRQ